MSTIARARAFVEYGYELTVFAFRRGRYNRDFRAAWPQIELGQTSDGNYRGRVVSLLRAVGILWRYRRLLRGASVLYARNIDQLALALSVKLFLQMRAYIAYEVLDVPAALARPGPFGSLLRWIERCFLHAVRVLVVSSPGFLRHFYGPVQGYRGPSFLLENKLHPSVLRSLDAPRPLGRMRPGSGKFKWVVGYFGLIRGRRTFDLIRRVAEIFPEDVLFRFSGVITTVDRDNFLDAIERQENMIYSGEYVNPDDLPRLYGQVDFAWAVDLEHEQHNSRWLMPCRFYEAGLFGVPCLTAHGFEVGERVSQLEAGWTFAAPYEQSLAEFFERLTHEEYDRKRHRLASLSLNTFVSSDEAVALCRLLDRERDAA